uniref:Uncharacterized protein n=1 Tax=Meloidogyne incognita TaxID=6306 RepID=A0A914MJJ2_MELIC
MTKMPEFGTVGNRKWLKSRNTEIERKKRRKSEIRFTSDTHQDLADIFRDQEFARKF